MAKKNIEELVTKVIEAEKKLRTVLELSPIVAQPPASDEDIVQFERKLSRKLPPSYRSFLKMHNGVNGFWGDFSLIGASGEQHVRLFNSIQRMVWINTAETDPPLVAKTDIENYEAQGHFYLPHHLVFGTDMGRELIIYNSNTKKRNGEMEVVVWRPDESPHPSFANFEKFLEWALDDIEKELDSLPRRSRKK